MDVEMALKRNSRMFVEDEAGTRDANARRSRRNSRQEDVALPEASSTQKTASASSRRTSHESSPAPRSLPDSAPASMGASTASLDLAVREKWPVPWDFLGNEQLPYLIQPSSDASLHRTLTPPGLIEGRPINFGMVVPGVYRSSYPQPEDYPFIRSLHLKTIVTLVQKDEGDETYSTFMSSSSIRHHVFDMKGTKKAAIPLSTMKAIIRLVLDRRNHPLMLHCNHGKHRTGCVVAIVRMVTGWEINTILDEYKSYAEPKIRDCDVQYISDFELSSLSNLFLQEANMRFRLRTFLRVTLFSILVLLIWVVSGQRMSSSTNRARDIR